MKKFGAFEKAVIVGTLAFGAGMTVGYNGFKEQALRDKISEEVEDAQKRETEGIQKAKNDGKTLKKQLMESDLRACSSLGKSTVLYMQNVERGDRQCTTIKGIHQVIADCKNACYEAIDLYMSEPGLFNGAEDIDGQIKNAKIQYQIAEHHQVDPRLKEKCAD